MKPLEIKIQNKDVHLSAGKAHNLSCVITGSRPAPLITWWKAGTRLFEVIFILITKISILEINPVHN